MDVDTRAVTVEARLDIEMFVDIMFDELLIQAWKRKQAKIESDLKQ